MNHAPTNACWWRAIDRLAVAHGLSVSGLARAAGLDPTAFNPSKRVEPRMGGKPVWPNTSTITKILYATNTSLDEFAKLMRS